MAKEKKTRAAQITPITNGWVVNLQESGPTPATQPVLEQLFYETAADACHAAAEFLEPQVPHIVSGKEADA